MGMGHSMGKIKINIEKAKTIKKERVREEREPLLKQLDVDYMRAQEEGKDTKEIVKEKQRLRDITNEIDKLTTVEELKAFKVK